MKALSLGPSMVIGAIAMVATLVAAPSALAGTADCRNRMPQGNGDVVYQLAVEAKRPGEADFSPVESDVLCATGWFRQFDKAVGFNLHTMSPAGFSDFPDDTTFRLSGSVPGFQAVAAAGGVSGLRLTTSGNQFAISARATTFRYALDQARTCVGPSNVPVPQFVGHMDGLERMGIENPLFGVTSGSNGTSWSLPHPGASGSLEIDVQGCGDADPATKEGFVDSFLPPKALSQTLGISQEQVAATDDAELGKLFSVADNGALASDLTFTKEPFQDGDVGVRLLYRLSFGTNAATPETGGASIAGAWARAAASGPASHTVAIARHGGLKPSAKPPGKPSVKWASSKKKRTVTATVSVASGSTVKHSISARKLSGGNTKRSGTCTTRSTGKQAVCSVKLAKGRWQVSVTPLQGTVAGTASSKAFRF